MAVVVLLMAATAASAQDRNGSGNAAKQRRQRSEAQSAETAWFPHGSLFAPLAADLKEPRNYASLRRTRFNGEAPPTLERDRTITAALLAVGSEFGIWSRRTASGDGVQVGVTAGVFTQFDMSSSSPTMLNADYLVGSQVTWRRGDVGIRSQLVHQSSHLGDGLLRRADQLGQPLEQRGPSMEWLDALLFLDGRHVRLYGTARYVLNTITPLAPWQVAAGTELTATPGRWGTMDVQPFIAVHLEVLEARAWGSTRSVMGGVALRRRGGSRGVRLSLVHLNGFTPFGKFFTSVQVRSFGVQLELSP